eukprot:1141772-Pelagomonas_calceolata.AAC.3
MEERNYSGVTLKITKNGADLVLPPHAIARGSAAPLAFPSCWTTFAPALRQLSTYCSVTIMLMKGMGMLDMLGRVPRPASCEQLEACSCFEHVLNMAQHVQASTMSFCPWLSPDACSCCCSGSLAAMPMEGRGVADVPWMTH